MINAIVFVIPSSTAPADLRDELIAQPDNANLFDGSGNLQLFLSPNEYTAVTEGEQTRVIGGFASTAIVPTKRRLGFEVKSQEGRLAAYRMMRQLDRHSKNNSVNLTVLDYLYLDQEADWAVGYRERSGLILSETLTIDGGTVRRWDDVLSDRYGKGLSFKFMETDLIV